MKTITRILTHQTALLLVSAMTLTTVAACGQATTGAATSGSTANDPAKTTLLQPMRQMIDKLKKLQATGDPDFDYAFQAKVHTQGVQDLLKQEIQSGKDTSLKQMAQTLLTATQADIAKLDETLRQLKPTRPNQAYTQQQNRNVEAMNLKLQQTGSNDKLTGDIDKNFQALLLDQRQDAIDMATTYLQYGQNGTLKGYAQDLVGKAKQQIEKLKTMK